MGKMILRVVLSLLVVFTGCSKKSADNGDGTLDGEQLVQERCVSCHGLDQVYSAVKDEQGWEESVDRMIERGTPLSEAERQAVIEYLSSR
jgi:mono/diheme cytochrome c family protein